MYICTYIHIYNIYIYVYTSIYIYMYILHSCGGRRPPAAPKLDRMGPHPAGERLQLPNRRHLLPLHGATITSE